MRWRRRRWQPDPSLAEPDAEPAPAAEPAEPEPPEPDQAPEHAEPAEAHEPAEAREQPELDEELPAPLVDDPDAAALTIREAAERQALERLAAVERELADPSPLPETEPEPEQASAPVDAEARIDRAWEAAASPAEQPRSASIRDQLIAELERTERELGRDPIEEQALERELADAEQRLTATEHETATAIERATARLEQVERRAAEAEERAERAERLASVKAEEATRAQHLREVLARIGAAERRASTAEERVRRAVDEAAQPLPGLEPPAPETAFEPRSPAAVSQAFPLNDVSYDELRSLGLSVTQAGRLLAHREQLDGFESLEDLDTIPGFSHTELDQLKQRLRISAHHRGFGE